MKSILKKASIWLFLCNKRLLKMKSFIVLLCLIPIVMPIAQNAMEKDSGIFRIALAAEDKSAAAESAISFMTESDSIIKFTVCKTVEDAKEMVADFKADAAWIFKDDFDKRISKFVTGEDQSPFIKIIEREETISLQLAREMLYGAVFNEVSFRIFKEQAEETFASYSFSEDDFRSFYNRTDRCDSIIEFSRLNSDAEIQKNSYLTGPTRGIMAIMVLFAALAAAIYFLKDQAEGKYDWLSVKKRVLPAFSLCISAAFLEGAGVLIAFLIANNTISFTTELCSMIFFVFAAAVFALNFCVIFKSYGKFGALLPGIVIISLILSPIFFNVDFLRPIRLLLPSHYYLYSLYDPSYYAYFPIYIISGTAVALAINFINDKKSNGAKLI